MVRKYPSFLNLSKSEWDKRIKKAWSMLSPCTVCPRICKVDRLNKDSKKYGFCRVKDKAVISSYHAHFGEEKCLVGKNGSGTIFFSSCNLSCVYCQNYEISQLRMGDEVTEKQLSKIMLNLEEKNCHNINLVSPSIYIPQILKSISIAVSNGLKVPIVYNTGGYDSVKSLKLLDGIVDIYMPDVKYSDSKLAHKYSLVSNYWEILQKALKEMHRQVGDLKIENGIARKGIIIRHLILPNKIAGTQKVMRFLAGEISKNTYVNLMDQYNPSHKANMYPKIARRITREEFEEAKKDAIEEGITRFD